MRMLLFFLCFICTPLQAYDVKKLYDELQEIKQSVPSEAIKADGEETETTLSNKKKKYLSGLSTKSEDTPLTAPVQDLEELYFSDKVQTKAAAPKRLSRQR